MPIITISRGSLSGGAGLAEGLAAALQADCLSREELIKRASHNFGIDEAELSESVDRAPSFWERRTRNRVLYLKVARSTLLDQARSGRLVYHGHAGHLVLRDVPCVLRVRLISSMDKRLEAAMADLHLTRDQAVQHIKKIDDARVRWTRFLYDVDWHDPGLYDITVNLEKVSMATAVDLVVVMAKSQDFELGGEHLTQIGRLALAARVEAALEAEPTTRGTNIGVIAEEGFIRLTGDLETEQLRQQILAVVRLVEGVDKVADEMKRRKASDIPT